MEAGYAYEVILTFYLHFINKQDRPLAKKKNFPKMFVIHNSKLFALSYFIPLV